MRRASANRIIQGLGFRGMAAAALAGAVALFSAGPARANHDFQNGFEDQLGRIAAYGAVNLGLQVLSGGYYPGVPAVAVAPVVQAGYYAPSYPAYYGPAYGPYYGSRTVVVKYPKAYRYGAYCNARNGYYGNRYGYHDGYRYDDHHDHRYGDDRGHGSHGNSYRGGRGRDW